MRILVSLRYPVKKMQMKTLEKTISLFPKARLFVLHISEKADAEKTKSLVREKFGKNAHVLKGKGEIHKEINKAVKNNSIDIVVLGQHRRNAMDIMLDGLVETDTSILLLKKIKAPVLVVK